MNVLFLNKDFSGILKELAVEMSNNCDVTFVSSINKKNENIRNIYYTISKKDIEEAPNYLKVYQEAIIHGQKTAVVLENLKKENYLPDFMIANSCGCAMYSKEIFQNIPLICLFDEFYNSSDENSENEKLQITYNKAYFMPDLAQCDLGIVTSKEQKEKIPECFQDKMIVINDLTYKNIQSELENLKERITK